MRAIGDGLHAAKRTLPWLFGSVLGGLAGVGAAGAADSCVAARQRPAEAIDAIRVVPHGFPPGLRTVVARAMELWNAPSCNGGGGFPRFSLAAESAHRVLHVRWVRGVNPRVAGSCGSFAGNQISLYSHARDPRDGGLRPCGNAARLAETLAHELGHALGLADQYGAGCQGHIMGQLTRTATGAILARRVRPLECAAADAVFLTLAERGGWAAGDQLAAELGAPAPGFTSRVGAAGFPPRSARIALGTLATESDGYRP